MTYYDEQQPRDERGTTELNAANEQPTEQVAEVPATESTSTIEEPANDATLNTESVEEQINEDGATA
jgi:hypothetical protein